MRTCLRYIFCAFIPIVSFADDITRVDPESCVSYVAGENAVSNIVTVEQAIRAGFAHRPELAIADCDIQAAGGRMLQAGLRPNPQLTTEAENFAGSGSRRAFQSTETKLQVSQLIELGRKRAKRESLASSERDLVVWDKEAKRLDVITDIRKAFIDVLANQTRVSLAEDQAALAKSVLDGVTQMVKAGKVSPIEQSRTMVAMNRAELVVVEMRNQLTVARQHLALQWGDADARFERVEGALDSLPPRPALSELEQQINNHPALARWPDEMQRRKNELELASAGALPDLAVSGGVRHFADNDDVGVVVGISVPLPFFNRNQGAILAAQANMDAADASLEVARRTLLTEIRDQYQALATAAATEESLRDQTLPIAQQVYEATTTGYRQGKFGLLEVLDAQRTLFESRREYVEAKASYQIAIAELERLTARSMEGIANDNNSGAGETP